MTTFEIFRRNNGRYYYRTIADSGHNLLSSDGFETKQECLRAIREAKENIMNTDKIKLEKLPEKEYKFILHGNGDNIVGYSMNFHSEKQCKKWIGIMQHSFPGSEITEIAKL